MSEWGVRQGMSGGGLLCFLSPPQSEPLQRVVDHMATRLGVSPSRILLLFGETELSPTATPRTLKLGVADIIGERKAGRWSLEEAFAAGRGCSWPGFQAPLRPGFLILFPADCVVLASSPETSQMSQVLQLRVQGKEKHQTLEVALSPVSGRPGCACLSPALCPPVPPTS